MSSNHSVRIVALPNVGPGLVLVLALPESLLRAVADDVFCSAGVTLPSQASCASTAGPTATSGGTGAASTASGSMTTTMTGSASGSTTTASGGHQTVY